MVHRGFERLLLTPVAAEARKAVSLEPPVNDCKLIAVVALGVPLDRERKVRRVHFLATVPAVSFKIVRA